MQINHLRLVKKEVGLICDYRIKPIETVEVGEIEVVEGK
jgi:hypothetical protein